MARGAHLTSLWAWRSTCEGQAVGGSHPPRYQSLERVQLCQDLPEHGLRRSESGTVVHVFETADAYLVEFVNPADGGIRALAELKPEQLAPAGEPDADLRTYFGSQSPVTWSRL